jgi:MarR family transcriptional regulator, organic hydroperoxide resistance regulator
MLTRPDAAARVRRANGEAETAKAGVDRDGLDDLLGFQLRLAYIAISRNFAAAVVQSELTQKQIGVLWLIGANPGVSQITLANELGMDRASMMAIVDRLEDRDLVVRERSPSDGRRQELHPTPKGRKTLTQCKAAIAKHERWMSARYNEAELAQLMTLLGRIHK